MASDDWDLFSIVRSCKATTFTAPTTIFETPPSTITSTTTNNIIFPHNTTPSCFDAFNFIEKNSSVPIAPLKPNDFIELDKLIISLNHTPTIPTLTSTNTSTIITTTTTTSTPLTTIFPSHITTNTITNTTFHGSKQNSTFFNFPKLIEQQQMELNELTDLEKVILQFYPNTIIPTSTITTPTPIIPINSTLVTTTTTFTTPKTTITAPNTTNLIIPTTTITTTTPGVLGTNQYPTVSDCQIFIEQQQTLPNHINKVSVSEPFTCVEVTTGNFGCACSNPSIQQRPLRKRNQLPILLPQTSSRVLPNTHPKQPKLKTRKRENNNQATSVFHVRDDEHDSWEWRKYGQKPIKGSSHPRSYYRCSTCSDCSAKKQVEKSNTIENTYVVTYEGEHNHQKPTVNRKSIVGTFWKKSPGTRLHIAREVGSCSNVRNLDSPNAEMLQFDQLESSKTHVYTNQLKVPYLKTDLIESRLPFIEDPRSPPNVGKLGSPNMIMFEFDEPESRNSHVSTDESEIPNKSTKFIGNSDDDVVLIPNMTPMLEDFLLDLNHLNRGALFP